MERPVAPLAVARPEDSETLPAARAVPEPLAERELRAVVVAPLRLVMVPGAVVPLRPGVVRSVGRVALRVVGRPARLRRDGPRVPPVVVLPLWARRFVLEPPVASEAIRSRDARLFASY